MTRKGDRLLQQFAGTIKNAVHRIAPDLRHKATVYRHKGGDIQARLCFAGEEGKSVQWTVWLSDVIDEPERVIEIAEEHAGSLVGRYRNGPRKSVPPPL